MSTLNRSNIAARIPHEGSMCLLERVQEWNEQNIVCLAVSHRAADNPLRRDGRIGVAIGIEYAAQAMAVHGSLLADRHSPPKKGMITRVQQIVLHTDRLDDSTEALSIKAERIMGDERVVRYRFSIRDEHRLFIEGEASVILEL